MDTVQLINDKTSIKYPWVYIFLKNPYLSRFPYYGFVFEILNLPQNFSPKLGYFQKKRRKYAKNEGKIQKSKLMNQK